MPSDSSGTPRRSTRKRTRVASDPLAPQRRPSKGVPCADALVWSDSRALLPVGARVLRSSTARSRIVPRVDLRGSSRLTIEVCIDGDTPLVHDLMRARSRKRRRTLPGDAEPMMFSAPWDTLPPTCIFYAELYAPHARRGSPHGYLSRFFSRAQTDCTFADLVRCRGSLRERALTKRLGLQTLALAAAELRRRDMCLPEDEIDVLPVPSRPGGDGGGGDRRRLRAYYRRLGFRAVLGSSYMRARVRDLLTAPAARGR